MSKESFGRGPKCPDCKKIVTKLVPFADMDQQHKGKMTCQRCKKAAKKVKVMETGETDLTNVEVADENAAK